MWFRLVVGVSVYKFTLSGLFQSEFLSDGMMRVLEDFPVVGLVVFTLYYVSKMQREDNKQNREWLEKMMEIQRINLKEIYDGNQAFLAALLNQMEGKQDRLVAQVDLLAQQLSVSTAAVAAQVELLSQQLTINTSTVNEIAKVDSIVSELIARLEHK